MADSSATPTEQVADAVSNLHLDEVTGERISKTECEQNPRRFLLLQAGAMS